MLSTIRRKIDADRSPLLNITESNDEPITFSHDEKIGICFLKCTKEYPQVVYVNPKKQADAQGIRVGDVLTSVNRTDLQTMDNNEIESLIRSQTANFTITRQPATVVTAVIGPWNRKKFANGALSVDGDVHKSIPAFGRHRVLLRSKT